MGLKKASIVIIIITILILINNHSSQELEQIKKSSSNLRIQQVTQYTPHAPIKISGNNDFFTQASNEKWPGDGTQSNPYIINGLRIENSSSILIEILDTNVYFHINDSIIQGGGDSGGWENHGIRLENVTNGAISNNIFSNTRNGINLDKCSNITIKKNYASDIAGNYGIHLENSDNNTIINNSFFKLNINADSGIQISNSDHNNISFNTVKSIENGIGVSNSKYNNISYNLIEDCQKYGMQFSSSRNNTIIGNQFFRCGIFLWGQFHNLNDYLQDNVSHNYVNEKPMIFWMNKKSGTVPSGAGQVILINCSSVEIKNQNLSSTAIGLLAIHSSGLVVQDNNFNRNLCHGIFLIESTKNLIKNNVVSDGWGSGITAWESDQNTVERNSITNNSGPGIQLYRSETNRIDNNTLSDNGYGDSAGDVEFNLYLSQNNTIFNNIFKNHGIAFGNFGPLEHYLQANVSGNLIEGRPIIFWQNINGRTVPDNASQVFLINCSNIEVTNHSLSYIEVGIFTAYSSHIQIHNNTIANSRDYGICMLNSEYTRIADNDIFITDSTITSTKGIYLFDSNNSIIDNNTAKSNYQYGIIISSSFNNSITENFVSDSAWGIALNSNSRNNTVAHNFIEKNRQSGIQLWSSSNNSLWNNTLWHNDHHGINLQSSSDNNSIYRNDFIETVVYSYAGPSQAYDEGTKNLFDYNHWDDWTSPDTNNDSVVDTPYTIGGPSNNNDSHPMVNPLHTEHQILKPEIIYPNSGETVAGGITITWKTATDSLKHTLTYSVYYSSDSGGSWIMTSTGIYPSSYWWDTTTVADGSNYLIKIRATCSRGLTAEDVSDATFTVANLAITTTPYTSSSIIQTSTTNLTTEPSTISSDSTSTGVPPTLQQPTPGWTWFLIAASITSIGVFRRRNFLRK